MSDRSDKINEYRRKQPIEELERKWDKARGRHSNQFWCTEWLDLAHKLAEIMCEVLGINDEKAPHDDRPSTEVE